MEKQQVHQSQGNKMKENPKIDNKNVNPKINKDNKAEEKKTEDKSANAPIIKVEKKAEEKKHTTPKKNYAVVNAKDLPISSINIKILNSNKDAICIQVLGEPQDIAKTITQVSEKNEYAVTFEEELVFSGKLR